MKYEHDKHTHTNAHTNKHLYPICCGCFWSELYPIFNQPQAHKPKFSFPETFYYNIDIKIKEKKEQTK